VQLSATGTPFILFSPTYTQVLGTKAGSGKQLMFEMAVREQPAASVITAVYWPIGTSASESSNELPDSGG